MRLRGARLGPDPVRDFWRVSVFSTFERELVRCGTVPPATNFPAMSQRLRILLIARAIPIIDNVVQREHEREAAHCIQVRPAELEECARLAVLHACNEIAAIMAEGIAPASRPTSTAAAAPGAEPTMPRGSERA